MKKLNKINLFVLFAILFLGNVHAQKGNLNKLLRNSEAQYAKYLKQYEIYNGPESTYLKILGENINKSFKQMLRFQGAPGNLIDFYDMEFNVVKMGDVESNIVVLPGGKVLVSLDTVSAVDNWVVIVWLVSHGLAHAIIEVNDKNTVKRLSLESTTAFDMSKEIVADKLGAIIMAYLGNDPETAVEFWKDIKDRKDFNYLKYHPVYENKIDLLRQNAEEAKAMAQEDGIKY